MTSDVIARKSGRAEGGVVETLERNHVMPAAALKSTPFLRLALPEDAAATGATALLRGADLMLLLYAAVIAWVGTRPAPPRWAVQAVVAQWTASRRAGAGAPLVLA